MIFLELSWFFLKPPLLTTSVGSPSLSRRKPMHHRGSPFSLPLWSLFCNISYSPTFSHLDQLVFFEYPSVFYLQGFVWLFHLPERLPQISVWLMTSPFSSFCSDDANLPSYLILQTAPLSCYYFLPSTYRLIYYAHCLTLLVRIQATWELQPLFYSLTYLKGLVKCLAHSRHSVNVCSLE